jgi:cytochrome c556
MKPKYQSRFQRASARTLGFNMTLPRTMASGLAIVIALTASPSVHADDQDVIDYRRHIMKTMGEEAAIVGMMMQHKVPAADFATHVQALATAAATAKKAFEPKVPGGDSKPDVWAQWPDFAKRLDALVADTDGLAKTAKEGGMAAAGPKVQTALTCKGCHDDYRVPKK